MKKIIYVLLFAICLFAVDSYGQEKLSSFGIVMKFKNKDTTLFNFSFSFNRVPGTEGDAGPVLKAFRVSESTAFAFRPSTEFDFGNGTETSPNNLLFDLGFMGTTILPSLKTTFLMYDITPVVTSDKDFTTGLIYLSLGVRLLYYNHPNVPSFYIMPGVNFDLTRRVEQSRNPQQCYRMGASLKHNLTYKAFNFSFAGKLFYVKKDTDVVEDGVYGNFSASIDLKVATRIGLSVKYVFGFEQPLYRKMNALSFGISLFR